MTSSSYKPCYCRADCYLFRSQEQDGECWGDVDPVDEFEEEDGGYGWVHACEGHRGRYRDDEPYLPEPGDAKEEDDD